MSLEDHCFLSEVLQLPWKKEWERPGVPQLKVRERKGKGLSDWGGRLGRGDRLGGWRLGEREGVPDFRNLRLMKASYPWTQRDWFGNSVTQERDDPFWALPLLRTSENVERKKIPP